MTPFSFISFDVKHPLGLSWLPENLEDKRYLFIVDLIVQKWQEK